MDKVASGWRFWDWFQPLQFAWSCLASVVFLSSCTTFLPQSNNVNIKLIEDSKLPLGVSDGLVTCPWWRLEWSPKPQVSIIKSYILKKIPSENSWFISSALIDHLSDFHSIMSFFCNWMHLHEWREKIWIMHQSCTDYINLHLSSEKSHISTEKIPQNTDTWQVKNLFNFSETFFIICYLTMQLQRDLYLRI